MKKYCYRNNDGELAWHDEPAPRARMRTLTNTFLSFLAHIINFEYTIREDWYGNELTSDAD